MYCNHIVRAEDNYSMRIPTQFCVVPMIVHLSTIIASIFDSGELAIWDIP